MYSSSNAAVNAHICLRCQRRLARITPLNAKPPFQARPARHLTSGQWHRQEHAEAYSGGLADEDTAVPFVSREEDPKDEYQRFQPASKHRRFRRLRVGEEVAKLGVDVLGQPAQIRIIRDRLRNIRGGRDDVAEIEQVKDDQSMSVSEILRTIDTEQGLVNSRLVNIHVEQLRESLQDTVSPGGSPTKIQFQDVAQKLYDGFKTSQLVRYIGTAEPDVLSKDIDFKSKVSGKTYTRSAWSPGVSSFPEEALRRLRTNQAPAAPSVAELDTITQRTEGTLKQRIVEYIMRNCWKFRTQEEENHPGELDIQVQEGPFSLVMNHRIDVFKKVSERFGAKIDISRSERIIRITADYLTSSEMFTTVQDLLENVLCEELNLLSSKHQGQGSRKTSQVVNKESMEEIEKLTHTIIRPVKRNPEREEGATKVLIYYLGLQDNDLEDAQRLILQSMTTIAMKETQVCYEAHTAELPVQTPVETGSGLLLADRATRWARWSNVAIPRSGPFEPEVSRDDAYTSVHPVGNTEKMDEIFEYLSRGSGPANAAGKPSDFGPNWQKGVSRSISATIGHILYPAHGKQIPAAKIQRTGRHDFPKTYQPSLKSRRIMHMGIPEILPTLGRFVSPVVEVKQELCILLSPFSTAGRKHKYLEGFPDIHLRIAINEESKTTSLSDVRLMIEERTSDLLLPDSAADVRFHSRSFLLGGSPPDPRISQFLEESNINIWGQDRLQTPARMTLSVPNSAIRVDPTDDGTVLGRTSGNDVPTAYSLTSLDHRSHIIMEHKGLNLVYSAIEAGRMGGRRDELHLMMAKPADAETPTTESVDFAQYFRIVRNIISMISSTVSRTSLKT